MVLWRETKASISMILQHETGASNSIVLLRQTKVLSSVVLWRDIKALNSKTTFRQVCKLMKTLFSLVWSPIQSQVCCYCCNQVGGSRRSTYATKTRCATWFSIAVRCSTYKANGFPHVTKLCKIMRRTELYWRCDWWNVGWSCHTSYCIGIIYVEPGFPKIQAGKRLWSSR